MTGRVKNVILVGASGNLGKPVLQEFISSSLFNVTVLTRESSNANFPSSINVIKTDYSPESVAKAFSGQDAVVSLVGSPGLAEQKKLVDAASKAGVKRFLPSEYGLNTASETVRAKVPVFAGKRAVVEYLESKEKDGLTWTALSTGPFFDAGLAKGFLGINPKDKTAKIWDGGNVSFTSTKLATIGKAIVSLLSTPERLAATENKYVYISSYTNTQNDLLEVAEKTTGSKFQVENIKSEEAGAKALEAFKKGDFSTVPELIRTAFLGSDELGNANKLGLSNDVLGLPKEDFETDVRRLLTV